MNYLYLIFGPFINFDLVLLIPFIIPLLVALSSKKIKIGFYSSIPILLFAFYFGRIAEPPYTLFLFAIIHTLLALSLAQLILYFYSKRRGLIDIKENRNTDLADRHGILRGILAFVSSIIISYFLSVPLGNWAETQYDISSSWWGIGSALDGFIFAYLFFAPILFALFTKNFKNSFFSALPLILFALSSFNDPWAKYDFIFVLLGLGLAYLLLILKKKMS